MAATRRAAAGPAADRPRLRAGSAGPTPHGPRLKKDPKAKKRIDLLSLNPAHPDRGFDLPEITWMHRIVWASQ